MAAPAPPSESQMPLRSTYIFSGVTALDVPARPLLKSPGKYFVTIAIDGKEEWKSREIQTRDRKVAWNQKEDKCELCVLPICPQPVLVLTSSPANLHRTRRGR
ncbi:hypothetical protein CALVIDRAFT_540426 [Calocera viscosa TUFC12733]|uniref:C2 domain-containing protein n=1 Tax=Calocera viscosa (strain TUFC12733) TaxID=1330018 RepID=A0A167ITY7_CALVF|nr:hypothetical protein CALVIDRAFT_540426 [Calocera viscosa TUFC12733]